jgi:lysyl-tRNA synthetase class 2
MSSELGTTEKELIENRLKKLDELKQLGVNPYPSRSDRNYMAADVQAKQDQLIKSEEEITVAGRIMAKRGHGKLSFVDLFDETGKVQVVVKEGLVDEKSMKIFAEVEVGDFIDAKGKVFITNAGELSVETHSIKILAKAIRPMPDKWNGLKDEELRFRKRYLEFITNPEIRELFIKKAKFWQATRNFMINHGFLEVETPVLENCAGGADASPFMTHHDALDMDVFLRISTGELWQKRLMVGGFDKTFEIGRQFRNEGISREHLQDYSQMEFYWGYHNYQDSMKLVQELYQYIAEQAFGTQKFKIAEFDVDLAGTWPTLDYVSTILDKMGINVLEADDEALKAKLKELHVHFEVADRKGRLIDLLWKQIRKTIAGPVFLINHPVEVSPLAKRKEEDPRLVERFQPIIAGSEMGNGYSELNDPKDQAERFLEQAEMREAGDAEAQMHDKDFVEALEYGMPPTSGFGFSERLFSFLANVPSREAQMFPLMRPEANDSIIKK